MFKKLFTFLYCLFLGCGRESPTKERPSLEQKYYQKLEELRKASASHVGGWPSDEDCDAALWAGVARAAGADWVDMAAAVQPDGRPTRRPFRDCRVPDESKATTSNDMMTGIILGNLSAKNLDTLKSLWDYGYANNWIMGYPEWFVARTLLRPNGITLLARSLHVLSEGRLDYVMRFSPVLYGSGLEDYEAHLALLSRYIQKLTNGPQYGTDSVEKELAERYPGDALAQALAGNVDKAEALLLSDYVSPSYVRGHANYQFCHWLLAAHIVLTSK